MSQARQEADSYPLAEQGAALLRPTPESIRRLRAQRENFLARPETADLRGVREVIARSWRRSLACKVDPAVIRSEIRPPRIDGPFLNVAMPVVDRLALVARDSGVGVVLSDSVGTIALMRGDNDMLRWAERRFSIDGAYMPEELTGTNSDGTALEEGRSVQVWGPEHWAEELQDTYCTSVPIRDPLRRRIAGVLTLMVPERIALATEPGALSLLVEGAAAEISRSAADRLSRREQALLQAYMREARVRGAEAVLAIDERTTIASNLAQQILSPDDYAVLSGFARDAERLGAFEREVVLAGERRIKLTAKPVTTDGDVVGAVIRLREPASTPQASRPSTTPARSSVKAFDALVGASAPMTKLRRAATGALERSASVCLTGERGTGRELLARLMANEVAATVHVVDLAQNTERSTADAVREIREHASAHHTAIVLLHADAAVHDLTTDDQEFLRQCAAAGRLFATAFQLGGATTQWLSAAGLTEIHVPPLRSRKDDIPALAAHILATRETPVLEASGRLQHALAQAEWPGNVSELRDVLLSVGETEKPGVLCLTDLGEPQRNAIARGRLSRLEAAELEQIRYTLLEAGGIECGRRSCLRSDVRPFIERSTATPGEGSTSGNSHRPNWSCIKLARFVDRRSPDADHMTATQQTPTASSASSVTGDLLQQVRAAHKSFPTGVTVVTSLVDGVPVGLAVNAFSSVSMEPPTVLVCVNSSSRSHDALNRATHLGINILSRDQVDVANTFATSGGDKFGAVDWHPAATGVPMLDGAAAAFEVEVTERVIAGTHTVFFGRVMGVRTSDHAPLLYSAGRFYDGGELLAV